MRLPKLAGPLTLFLLNAPSASASATATPTTTTPSCSATALPPIFLIDSRTAAGKTTYYALSIGSSKATNETYRAASTNKAARFSVKDTCLNADECGIPQLVYNGTTGTQSGPAHVYKAYVPEDGGAVVFTTNRTAALNAGLAAVTAQWSQSACEIVLIPYLDHDVSNVFDCSGKISLFGSQAQAGCKAVKLGFTAV